MRFIWKCVLTIFLEFFCLITAEIEDSFHEELILKPLSNGYIYSYFQFTTLYKVSNNPENLQHTHLFSRGLSEIISRHSVDELHVSLTEGFWDYKKYGYPFFDAAPGAEIYAWFNSNVSNVNKQWKGLTNALSGLLCASFNFVDTTNSLSPEFTFRSSSAIKKVPKSSHLRYSSLPRETACTENLTPFKKLLPCNSKKGLASLLNSASIHNTNYHSIGIHFRTVCQNPNCTKISLELKQTVSLIYDTVAMDSQDWSLRKLFGAALKSVCPVAETSKVYIDITSNNTAKKFKLVPEPDTKVLSLRGGQENMFAIYDIKSHIKENAFSLTVLYSSQQMSGFIYPSVLYVNRYIIGYGQEKGSLVTKMYNNHWKSIDIVLLENVPWYLPLYLHSLKITCSGKIVKPLLQRYVPGKERTQPYYLELILRLPPHSETKFSVDVDYTFLKWQEYPPDANHGFYMGPAVITALLPIARNYTALPQDGHTISSLFNATREGYIVQLRTEIILISLPTPDFSMPYNVICLACTAVALAFGPLHNIATKRLVLKRIEDQSIKNKLVSFIKRILKKEKTD